MMENIMNAVNAVMSACRESLDHTNDDYERVTILVSRVGWVQVLNDAQVMKPECLLRVADSTGRCNTLSEQHCSAKMYLNQRNSQRF
jgi:hypothetical protein